MQGPGIYVLQTMPGDHDVDSGSGRGFHSSAAQPASSAAQPGSSAAQLANYKVWCWAECQKVAMPCKRNREEMIAAFEDFKRRFFDLPEQKSKDPEKKRSRLNAHMEAVFGHCHGVWDYLHTGDLPSLHPATAPLPLHKRVIDDEISMHKRRRSI